MTLKNIIAIIAISIAITANAEKKLSGTPMGTGLSNHPIQHAFDGNMNTFFCGPNANGYHRSWVGLDLGSPHIITRVGVCPSIDRGKDIQLAIIQGANNPDFSDALPIAMIDEKIPNKTITYFDVNVSRGFRYVRAMAGPDGYGHYAELEFYGNAGAGDDTQLFQLTNLPTIVFNTPGMAEIKSKDDKHPGSFVAVISDDGKSILSDNLAQLKGRGNSSWNMPKKPFQIKFNKKKQILPNAPAKAKKWTLINNYGDKTLMRNKIAFQMSKDAGMTYAPYCQFVDVIYNGQYEGCYQLCDQLDVKPGRIDITEMTPDDNYGEALTGGYFLEIDAYAYSELSWFASTRGTPVTIKSPDEKDITREQKEYIRNYFNKLETALFSSNFKDPTNGYRKYLDLESFLRYFISGELNGNTDSYWSTYLWKERSDPRFHIGPIWDIDLGFDNDKRTYPISQFDDFFYTADCASAAVGMKNFVNRIIKNDPQAREMLTEIWSDLRNNGNFNEKYFSDLIDSYVDEIQQSQKLNFIRWPILDKVVHENPMARGSFENEIRHVKSFIAERIKKLDNLIGLKQSGIDEIEFDPEMLSDENIQLFNLKGQKVNTTTPAPGIYILKMRNGTARKVLIK
ncbi:MAG: CotH kinase family protein [Muribaculaceae bacterium]|nr:CotH kinase family protein [Muribaculaceae bacterium]